jgi:hypothetical protein
MGRTGEGVKDYLTTLSASAFAFASASTTFPLDPFHKNDELHEFKKKNYMNFNSLFSYFRHK